MKGPYTKGTAIQLKPGLLACTISALLAGLLTAPATYAQDEEDIDEIVVTGSRIRRQDYNTANPIATFTGEELENLGIVNAGDAMKQMPSNVARFTPQNTGGSAFQIGGNLADLRGLNPFFGTRTMTLVDTRRHVATNQGGSVDLNFIPSTLIGRIETVTGGASASYGADAISGVVNILLDTRLEGGKLDIDMAQTSEGDGDNQHAAFAYGTAFADGRGHIVFGAEMQDQDVIQDCSTARSWCGEGNGLFSNGTGGGAFGAHLVPYTPAVPGKPYAFKATDLRNQTSVYGTTFNSTAGAQRYRFNAAGTDIVPYDAGQYAHLGATQQVMGGEGPSIYKNLTLMPDVSREVFMAHATWDFSDTLQGFVEVSSGSVKGTNIQAAPGQNFAEGCVTPTNPYLLQGSAAMQAEVLARANTTNFFGACFGATPVGKDWSTEVQQRVDTDTEVLRVAAGLDGEIGSWNWSTYYQYGETERSQIGSGYRTNHRFAMAMNSMVDPATGRIECAVTVLGAIPLVTLPDGADPSLAAGCKPLNPFGLSQASPEALDYAWAELTEFNTIELNAWAFNLNGEIWEGWGYGPLSGAFGIEYRTEDFVNDAGPLPLPIRTDFGLQYGDAFAGDLEALEYYGEVEMPLLAGKAFAKQLTMNVAARQAKYTNEGGVLNLSKDQDMTTWKISSIWDVNDWLRIRGSVSHDARAPTYRELYYSQTIPAGGFFGRVDNPWLPDLGPFSQSDVSQLVLAGNVEMKPEEADTYTYGFVVTPTFLDGLQFSADYYEIELTDGIALGVGGSVVQACFQRDELCEYITFDPNVPNRQNITSTTTLYDNGLPYNSSGVDLAANYMFPVSNLFDGAEGDLSLRMLATRSLETVVRVGGASRNITGQTGGDQGFLSDYSSSPDWSVNTILTYMNGPLVLTAQARYIDSGVLNKQTPFVGPDEAGFDPGLTNTVDDNTVPSHTVWGFNGAYTFELNGDTTIQVFLNIENLFDREPPFSAGSVGGANAQFFDALGRNYRLGLRTRF